MAAVGSLVGGPYLDDVRVVHASAAAIHNALTDALGRQGFRLALDQLTHLEARRGSVLAGALDKTQLAVQAHAWVMPQADGCQVQVRLQYRGIPLPSTSGAQSALREAFFDTGRAIDLALARVDPAARFAPAILTSPGSGGSVQEPVDFGVASEAEPQPNAQPEAPGAWTAREGVLFTLDGNLAWLDPDSVQAHLAIARLILDTPGALPTELHAELEPFTLRIEQSVAANPSHLSVVQVTKAERTVLAFMHQQVRIRSAMPVRTLHRCRDCHLEKVTNPDYARAVQRSRTARGLGGAVGATFTRGAITPIVLIGTLFQLRRLDPDYVCPRCQGMSAEESFVTYCGRCGELRREPVLRKCAKCDFDFRSVLRKEQFWVPEPTQPPGPTAPSTAAATVSAPPTGPRGGKICRTCGREFATLWRVVVATSGQPEDWFVCATTPQCTPESVTDPVLI